ncbi:MAG: response regulator [Myxococcota bacterium]
MAEINASEGSSPRVLIVDDEDIIRELLAEFLGSQGFSITLAGSAEEAWPLVTGVAFDAVLIDYGLPGMNGIEFCKRTAAQGIRSRMALMTGWGSMDAAEVEPSISRVIAKPFDLMAILKAVTELTAPA